MKFLLYLFYALTLIKCQSAGAEEPTPPNVGPAIQIGLKCPDEAHPTIELLYKVAEDSSQARLSVMYVRGTAVRIILETAAKNKPFSVDTDIDLHNMVDDLSKGTARAWLEIAEPVRESVCLNTQAFQAKYFAALAKNRARLHSP